MFKIREEKGSITLIVVVTILFIMITLIAILVSNSNLNISSKQETQRIKENYEKDINNINEVYERAVYELGLNASEIASNPTKYYGKEVQYTPQNGAPVGWKIFYADDENIYLIASDCVENKYAPTPTNGTSLNTSTTYKIYFETIGNSTNLYPVEEDKRVTKWISGLNNFAEANYNMKATAYLLDTDAWSTFKDENNKAEYIIGSPTLELFMASYNDIHQDKTIQCEITNSTGYSIKWNTDPSYTFRINGLNTSERLYVLSSTNVNGYWLASPSAGGNHCIFHVYWDEYIYYDYSSGNNYGNVSYRPIVCLKSTTQLLEQTDGTYIIQ